MDRCDKFIRQCSTCAYGDNTDFCEESDCSKCHLCTPESERTSPDGSTCRCLEAPEEGEETCKYYKDTEERGRALRLDVFFEQCHTCIFGCGNGYCPETNCLMCRMHISENDVAVRNTVCRCAENPDEDEQTCKYYTKMEEDKQ